MARTRPLTQREGSRKPGMNGRKIALAGMALAAIGVLAALGTWALAETATAVGGNSITSPDTAGSVGSYTSLALDSSGFPVVSYYDSTNRDLKLTHCNDPNCSGGDESITSPDTAGSVGRFTSLTLDSTGYPVVSYYDATNQNLKVMHCNDPNCAGGDESITSPDSAGAVGEFTSLALDASGYPVISYYDAANRDLNVMHCNDPDCAGGDESITSPDTAGDVGFSTSLALDASGYPVVGYWDATSEGMKVLHCDDPDCTGDGESITMPRTLTLGPILSPIIFGHSVSLALDASGNPVVAYCVLSWAGNDCGLVVLHCNDPDCAGGDESITWPVRSIVAGDISLVLDASGNPVVSYQDDGFHILHHILDPHLAVMRCNDPNCSGRDESIARFYARARGGASTSLALDTSGYPVVSYAGMGDLNVVHCNDPLCGAGKPRPTLTPTSTPTASRTPTATMTPFRPPGDASCDGVVDAQDAALILQFKADLLGSLPCPEGGDANNDGNVTSIDAALILQLSAGLIDSLPA